MQPSSVSPASFAQEFATVALGDRRREQRLLRIVEQCRAAPDSSFPEIAPTTADLTALYRFIGSSAVTPGAILEPHSQQTAARCAEARKVLVVHDTTECEFPGKSRRLGPLRGDDQGFLAHVALAIAAEGSRLPLGILGVHTWQRSELGRGRKSDGTRKSGGDYHKLPDKESARWFDLIDQTEGRLNGVEAIHVGDRETDKFHLLRDALDRNLRFVFRMARDRRLLDENDDFLAPTSEALVSCDDVFEIEVPLSRRRIKSAPRTTESARDARVAKLAVRGFPNALVARPHYDRTSPPSLDVNLVYVHELDPPADVEPVSWVLMTTELVATPRHLRDVIEIYRARWTIEELFKALKTGCAFEKRQLESYETLTNALGIFLPIAWHLLLLRHHARATPQLPAEIVLSPTQLDVLSARIPNVLPPRPTAADALRAVAYLGGHFIKRPPGWLVLGRGLEKLLLLEAGWRLAKGIDPDL